MIKYYRKAATELNSLISSKTVRNTGFIFTGNLAGQFLGFLASLIVIRVLGPERFGLFSTAIAVMGLASQFSDLGISTGFVRYAAVYLKEDQRKADILFKITLYLKFTVALFVLLLGLIIAKPIAVHVFRAPELTPLLQLAFVGSLGGTLWGYLQTVLQAKEWFVKYAWINVFNSSLKLVGITLLFYGARLSELNALCVFIVVPFAGFFIDGLIAPKKFLTVKGSQQEKREIFLELFHFSKWVTISTLCTMFMMRLDVFMIQSISTPQNVGIYNSANQLAMIFPLISGAIMTSLLPKVVQYTTKDELKRYIKKNATVYPLLILFFIPLMVFSKEIIPFLLGPKYISAIPIFKIILIGFIFAMIINPLSLVFYSLNKAQYLTYLNILQFIIAVPLNYIFINHYGAIGASWTNLLLRVFAFTYIVFLLSRELRRMEHVRENQEAY